jgi:hypothetical protein
MRQPYSLFSIACTFINKVPVGKTFTSKDYVSTVGKFEMPTRWKTNSNNPHYATHSYKTELKKAGFITKVRHSVWKVERHIPSWFSSGHIKVINGYTSSFKGMDRTDIIAQCDEDAHYAMGFIIRETPFQNRPSPTQDEPGLPKLRKLNYETYQKFIWSAKDLGIEEFRTQNELAAYIEDLKWPGVGNDGTKPRYSIKGNYFPIIEHLMADGILTRKKVDNRWVYTVHITNATQPKEQIRSSIVEPVVKVKAIGGNINPYASAKRIAKNSTYGAYGKKESLLQKLYNMETTVRRLSIQLQTIIKEITE